jgi:hypothetical protein
MDCAFAGKPRPHRGGLAAVRCGRCWAAIGKERFMGIATDDPLAPESRKPFLLYRFLAKSIVHKYHLCYFAAPSYFSNYYKKMRLQN